MRAAYHGWGGFAGVSLCSGGFAGVSLCSWGLRRGQPLFLVLAWQPVCYPGSATPSPIIAAVSLCSWFWLGSLCATRGQGHHPESCWLQDSIAAANACASRENVRRQILDEQHGVVEWAVDLIRDAENNGSVRLRPLLAFRRQLPRHFSNASSASSEVSYQSSKHDPLLYPNTTPAAGM